jgi:hypothetical protein
VENERRVLQEVSVFLAIHAIHRQWIGGKGGKSADVPPSLLLGREESRKRSRRGYKEREMKP